MRMKKLGLFFLILLCLNSVFGDTANPASVLHGSRYFACKNKLDSLLGNLPMENTQWAVRLSYYSKTSGLVVTTIIRKKEECFVYVESLNRTSITGFEALRKMQNVTNGRMCEINFQNLPSLKSLNQSFTDKEKASEELIEPHSRYHFWNVKRKTWMSVRLPISQNRKKEVYKTLDKFFSDYGRGSAVSDIKQERGQ